VDELEAIRLADYLGLSHEEAARHLKVSRPTVTRMLARAHQAIADALVHGKAIRIEGGDYTLRGEESHCPNCGASWLDDSQVCQNCHYPQGEGPSPDGF
jgi:ribosomal protein S27AE